MALLGVLDAPQVLSQAYAWAMMLHDRTPTMGVAEALDSTFSGEAPCALCCAIQKKREKQQKETPIPEAKPSIKYPPASTARKITIFPPLGGYETREDGRTDIAPWRVDSPLKPPPQDWA